MCRPSVRTMAQRWERWPVGPGATRNPFTPLVLHGCLRGLDQPQSERGSEQAVLQSQIPALNDNWNYPPHPTTPSHPYPSTWSIYELDLDGQGRKYKPGSLYVEA